MGIRLENAFQCQKVLYPKHEQEEPSLLCIKQPNSGTSTIKPLPRTHVKKPVPHLDSSGEIFNTVLENAEERIYCSRKINYGIWINHMGSISKTGNNKTGEYSKKGSQVHSQRLQKQGRRMHD